MSMLKQAEKIERDQRELHVSIVSAVKFHKFTADQIAAASKLPIVTRMTGNLGTTAPTVETYLRTGSGMFRVVAAAVDILIAYEVTGHPLHLDEL